MKAIVVTDQSAGKAGMKLAELSKPQAAINDVVVQVYASCMTGDELSWPSTWVDRAGRDRTPSVPPQAKASRLCRLYDAANPINPFSLKLGFLKTLMHLRHKQGACAWCEVVM